MKYKLIKYLFKKKALCWGQGEENFNLIQKSFYWLKTLLTMLLRIENKKCYYPQNDVPFIMFGFSTGFEGDQNWTEISVGKGVFKNWFFSVYPNGT